MDPVELLALLGGVAERSSLVGRYRTSPRALARAVAEGRLLRVRRGCYALPGADPVRVAEVAWRAVPTCITAARQLGLPVLSSDKRLHLAFGAARTFSGNHLRPPSSVRAHFVSGQVLHRLATAQVIDATGSCLSGAHQLVLLDAGLQRGALLLKDIETFTLTAKRRVAWLQRYADDRTESPLETLTRLAMRQVGLKVESQVSIEGVGRVDFLVEGRVIVEADGRTFHSDPVTFAADRRRDRAAAALGLPVLRFTYAEIIADPESVAREVRALCHRGSAAVRK